MTNNLKNFTGLDFDTAKSNLRTYMESQDKLKDYNFDGSMASLLLDILAFNTMYNAVYANMSTSERFLATAQQRSSIVALAKNLGYVPRSVKSAKSNITLTVTYTGDGSPTSIVLPAGSKFTGKNSDGKSLVFSNRSAVYLTPTTGNDFAGTFDIHEGKSLTYKEVLIAGQKGIVLPNTGVDTELLTVYVRPSASSNTPEKYEKVNDFSETTNQNKVFFVEEVEGEKHRVYFGDGVVGKSIVAGNQVEISYYKSSGSEANNINTFTLADTVSDTQTKAIAVNSVSSGGADIETLDTIRNTAPLFYQAQNRAVTTRDYASIVKTFFSDIQDIAVWGGEDATPPSYGKVFIAAMPKFGDFISQTRKNEIQEFLKDEYAVMTIESEVVDPDYLYLEVTNTVEFSSSETSVTAPPLKSQITTKIYEYENESLKAFNKSFRLSKLSGIVDAVNPAISSNNFTVQMSIRPPDLEDVSQTNTLEYSNPIVAGSVLSSRFDWLGFSNVFLKDNGKGNLELYRIAGGLSTPINDDVGNVRVAGTIDYTTGKIVLNPNVFSVLDVLKVYNETLHLNALPVLDDIKSTRRKVIRLCNTSLDVNVVDLITGITV